MELLPKIADIFGITLDELFDREGSLPDKVDDLAEPEAREAEDQEAAKEPEQESGREEEECASASEENTVALPWEDDGTLRAVLFIGRKMVQVDKIKETLKQAGKEITFSYSGSALNVESYFNICCEEVEGNVKAGGNVDCGDVSGDVKAGGNVDCGDVSGDVTAQGDVDCGDVGGCVYNN